MVQQGVTLLSTGWMTGIQYPTRAEIIFFVAKSWLSLWCHLASHPNATGRYVVSACCKLPSSACCQESECMEFYLHFRLYIFIKFYLSVKTMSHFTRKQRFRGSKPGADHPADWSGLSLLWREDVILHPSQTRLHTLIFRFKIFFSPFLISNQKLLSIG
jgi:hypothetical protein